MSLTETGLYKCESCGHFIDRGRLTCKNCGAVSPIKQVVSDIDFYTCISVHRAYDYDEALNKLKELSIKVDSFIANSVLGEAPISDFYNFWMAISSDIHLLSGIGSWQRPKHYRLKDNVKLFMTTIRLDEKTSFYRFVAIEDHIALFCEINCLVDEYIDDLKWEITKECDLEQKQKKINSIQEKINGRKDMIASDLESLDKKQAELKESNEQLIEWERGSFMHKRKHKRSNTTKLSISIIELKKVIESNTQEVIELEKNLTSLSEKNVEN